MAYITENDLDNTLDLPVQLPLTKIAPGDWLALSSFCLASPQTLNLRLLQLQVLAIDVSSPYTLNQTGLGICYLGLYKDYTDYTTPPTNPLEVIIVGNVTTPPPVFSQRTTIITTYSNPGLYTFIVTNNTTGNLTCSALGQIRLKISA
jgi:hypothetical protein